jgi:hypothetical protein
MFDSFLKLTGAFALGVGGAVLLMGQAAPGHVVEANRFVLRDADGAERAVLAAEPNGDAVLRFVRVDGKPGIELVLTRDGRASVEALNVGTVKMGAGSDGTGYVVIRDKNGNQQFRAPLPKTE